MRVAPLAFLFVTAVTTAAAAEDATTAPPPAAPSKSLAPLLGLHLGTVATGRHLGQSLDLAIDVGVRKRFGTFAFVTGLRPHYERYALGLSRDLGCAGANASACAAGSAVYRTQTNAHALGLEIPLMLEYQNKTVTPFLGLSPSVVWLSATERQQGLLPRAEPIESNGSKAFLALSAFGGLAVPIGSHGSFAARVGYRFAPSADLPGGNASIRGVLASIGYVHEL